MWREAGRPDLHKHPLPVPVIVLLYHGSKPLGKISMKDIVASVPGLERFVPDFEIVIIDLTTLHIEDLRGEPLTCATLETLKRASDHSLGANLVSVLRHFKGQPITDQIREWIRDLLLYANNVVKKLTFETINKAMTITFGEQEGKMMTNTYLWEIEAKGEAKGEVKGEVKAIRRFLKARFGNVPQEIDDAVAAYSDSVALDSLTELAATCRSLDEFKEGL
jgi:hypothetical protein